MIGTPDGDLLGDEARRAVIDALLSMPPGDAVAAIDWPTGTAGEPELLIYEDDIADAAIRALNPVVAALVSQAREAGAAEERERCADELREAIHPSCQPHYVDRERLYTLAQRWVNRRDPS